MHELCNIIIFGFEIFVSTSIASSPSASAQSAPRKVPHEIPAWAGAATRVSSNATIKWIYFDGNMVCYSPLHTGPSTTRRLKNSHGTILILYYSAVERPLQRCSTSPLACLLPLLIWMINELERQHQSYTTLLKSAEKKKAGGGSKTAQWISVPWLHLHHHSCAPTHHYQPVLLHLHQDLLACIIIIGFDSTTT